MSMTRSMSSCDIRRLRVEGEHWCRNCEVIVVDLGA